jgi:hypothetical protein
MKRLFHCEGGWIVRLRRFPEILPGNKILAVFLALTALAFPAWAAQPFAASVKTVQGNSAVIRSGETIAIREGMHLLSNDLLKTSADSRLGIIFQDGTRISLGPRTEVRIDRFLYEPADGKLGLMLSIARGILAYISGKISQLSPDSVGVTTPTCVIGLRGTHFAISIDEP